MDKASSVIAAFDAGKLPSTQQFTEFIDWLDKQGITALEPSSSAAEGNLTTQGRVLLTRLRDILHAYKQLANNKNGDNIVQEAVWHLSQGDVSATAKRTVETSAVGKLRTQEQVKSDIEVLRNALRSILLVVWSSLTAESNSLVTDFASVARLSLADAAELIETSAASAKQNLREVEQGVQRGERMEISGRNKERVEQERADVKAKWEHGMDTVKGAGDAVIDTGRTVSESAKETTEKSSARLKDAYIKMCDRAQSDPQYRDAITTLISVPQIRLHQAMDKLTEKTSESTPTFSSFIDDPTSEKHVSKALDLWQTFLERLASNTSLTPLLEKVRECMLAIGKDDDLCEWFDDFFRLAKRNLIEQGFVRSDESKKLRKDLRGRWKVLLEKDSAWKTCVDEVKLEVNRYQEALDHDADLLKFREAMKNFGRDLERGLVEAGSEGVTTGLEAVVERATWFWQDLVKVYIPRFIRLLGNLPIPRTEYKDAEIEFVLENLDISTLNIHPAHVFIRNITDVDVKSTGSAGAMRTAVGTLTHMKAEAIQLALDDVSFYYRELNPSTMSPKSYKGLLSLKLPPKGLSLDVQVRLIPSSFTYQDVRNSSSRESLKHFNVIEHVRVSISDDVEITVKESNHPVLTGLFKPIVVMRLREALEKTLEAQIQGLIDWMDGIAYDVAEREAVFEDLGWGIGGPTTTQKGGAFVAALWSEFGKMRRERIQSEAGLQITPTGTGIILAAMHGEKSATQLAVGAEPQILSGEKRGPLGTGAESLSVRVSGAVKDTTGFDISSTDAESSRAKAGKAKEEMKSMAEEGKNTVKSFVDSVQEKKRLEERKSGWKSAAFDIVA